MYKYTYIQINGIILVFRNNMALCFTNIPYALQNHGKQLISKDCENI